MQNKLNQIREALNKKFFEREEEIEGLLVSLLSGQHMLLIGEPGTGKSLLSMELANIINGSSYFQWLLTKYTTPDELFGPLSLQELEKGIHARNTSGKLPEAHFVFLDEIFKSNSAILNSLLTLMNERLFYNNGTPIKSPLISLIGASNEYPEENEGLEAMYDRLLLKYEVKAVQSRENRIKIRKREGSNVQIPSLTLNELRELQFYTSMVNMSDEMHELLDDIYIALIDEGIHISQRRTDQSINTIKAKAFLNHRTNVEKEDLSILQHIFWNNIDEREIATQIIKDFTQDKISNLIDQVKDNFKDVVANFEKLDQSKGASYDDIKETAEKLKVLRSELDKMMKSKGIDNEKATEISQLMQNIADSEQRIIELALRPIN